MGWLVSIFQDNSAARTVTEPSKASQKVLLDQTFKTHHQPSLVLCSLPVQLQLTKSQPYSTAGAQRYTAFSQGGFTDHLHRIVTYSI